MDLLLDPARENRKRVVRALVRFGAPEALVQPLLTAQLDEIVWLGRAPSRIDLLLSAPAGTRRPSRRNAGSRARRGPL